MKRYTQGARGRSERLEDRVLLAADTATNLPFDEIAESPLVEVASYDGVGNNVANSDWGAAFTELLRITTVEYADGSSTPAGEDRASARVISNNVASQIDSITNDRYLTDFVWIWGQFIDHDIDLSVDAEPIEEFDITVPMGDVSFDPLASGEVTIGLDRSDYVVDDQGVRQQVNTITSYIDGSVVYGSDIATADSLRTFEGGRMLTSDGDLLPVGENGFFRAGDVRANENVALTSMHTLWVREHNRLADEIAAADPALTDEEIYQQARALVTAEIQAITYNQWLPALLGVDAIDAYNDYDPSVNASIANVFSTAAYRFGHSMLSSELLRLDADGNVASEGNLSLAEAFFSPDQLLEHGIESLLLGAGAQVAQEIDTQIVDDVRNFLFGAPGDGGLDLASLNIQRGRDHGLANYNQVREDYDLERVASFTDITTDVELAQKLEQLYGTVDNIDPWVGILAEDHVEGSSLGELGRTILIDQFTRLRDGDRLWYENRFDGAVLSELRSTTLADVIERNTAISDLRENVFLDESIFYYAADYDANQLDATLRVERGELRLVSNKSGAVLSSGRADAVNKVVLVGTSGDDRVVVHPSAMNLNLAGGVVVDGQQGRRDVLTLSGGRSFDAIAIDGAFASFGDTVVQTENFERVVIRPGDGPDDVQVLERGDYDLIVDDTRHSRDRHERDQNDTQRDSTNETDRLVDTRLDRRARMRR